MTEPPVVDASPLIYLSRSGLVELLRVIGPVVLVPPAVAEEIRGRGMADPTVIALGKHKWLQESGAVRQSPKVRSWQLGRGETSVLSWAANHRNCKAIIDDRQARRCAALIGVPCIGTLGIVLIAKRAGVISAARPTLNALELAGMYLSPRVRDGALKLVGE